MKISRCINTKGTIEWKYVRRWKVTECGQKKVLQKKKSDCKKKSRYADVDPCKTVWIDAVPGYSVILF